LESEALLFGLLDPGGIPADTSCFLLFGLAESDLRLLLGLLERGDFDLLGLTEPDFRSGLLEPEGFRLGLLEPDLPLASGLLEWDLPLVVSGLTGWDLPLVSGLLEPDFLLGLPEPEGLRLGLLESRLRLVAGLPESRLRLATGLFDSAVLRLLFGLLESRLRRATGLLESEDLRLGLLESDLPLRTGLLRRRLGDRLRLLSYRLFRKFG